MKRINRLLMFSLLFIIITGSAMAQSDGLKGEENKQTVTFPEFSIYTNPKNGAYLKPILKVASGIMAESFTNPGYNDPDKSTKYEDREHTFAVIRFGLVGNLGNGITFKSEFQRDPGTYGTGVWTGTASLAGFENWVRYEKLGAALSTGIILDPTSVDFTTVHINNTMGQDAFTQLPPIYSGINLGQGVMVEFNAAKINKKLPIHLVYTYTSNNPLATTVSYPWGGKTTGNGGLNENTTRNVIRGDPGTDAMIQIHSIGGIVSAPINKKILNLQLVYCYQMLSVDTNKTKSDNVLLSGYNWRTGVNIGVFNDMIRVFGNYNQRKNEQYPLNPNDGQPVSQKIDDHRYEGNVTTIGSEFNWNKGIKFGIGFSWSVVYEKAKTESSLSDNKYRDDYYNVGFTYYINNQLSLGARYSLLITTREGEADDNRADVEAWTISMNFSL